MQQWSTIGSGGLAGMAARIAARRRLADVALPAPVAKKPRLALYGSGWAAARAQRPWAKNCTSLTANDLDSCDQITGASIETLPKNRTPLPAGQLFRTVVETLAKKCTSLTAVDFSEFNQATKQRNTASVHNILYIVWE
jgi:hypothetical protein